LEKETRERRQDNIRGEGGREVKRRDKRLVGSEEKREDKKQNKKTQQFNMIGN